MGMGLQDRGAGSHDFPSFAPGVARGTEGTQTALGRRPIWGLGKARWRAASRVPSTSKTTHWFPCRSDSPPGLLFVQRASQQIIEKQRTQGLDRGLVKRREKARERRTRRQAITSEERHERACTGLHPLVKGFQGAFAADGIAEEYGQKIDHVVASEATTCKAHLFVYGSKHALALQAMNYQSDFPEPAALKAPNGERSGY